MCTKYSTNRATQTQHCKTALHNVQITASAMTPRSTTSKGITEYYSYVSQKRSTTTIGDKVCYGCMCLQGEKHVGKNTPRWAARCLLVPHIALVVTESVHNKESSPYVAYIHTSVMNLCHMLTLKSNNNCTRNTTDVHCTVSLCGALRSMEVGAC